MKINNAPTVSEQAYQRFITTLSKAADVINGPTGARDERERAEGFRHLLRLASLATEQFVEKGDPQHPAFTRWMEAGRKLLGDNPWTIYDSAQVTVENSYRIYGNRKGPSYIGFCVYGTKESGDRCIVSNIDDTEMRFDDNGDFELLICRDRPVEAVNWIALDDDATDVMVRQYFINNSHNKKAHYVIETTNFNDKPAALTEQDLATKIDKAAAFFEEVINVEATLSAFAEESTPVLLRNGDNYEGSDDAVVIDYAWVAKAMPTPAILYTGSWVNELGDDEAIVVEGKAPNARYWSVQLLSRWMESPDYHNHNVLFTSENTQLDADGRFKIVVANNNPGAANWLNMTGLKSGGITVRALKAAAEEELDIVFNRVKISSL